jgi:hypothetical protein
MDFLSLALFAVFIVSMVVVGDIAGSQGRRVRPWVWTAAVIGPLAIPMLYLVPRGSPAGHLPVSSDRK